MGVPKEIAGQRFGRLLVLHVAPKRGRYRRWVCRCDCGEHVEIVTYQLLTGKTRSCGCLHRELWIEKNKTHGRSRGPEYASWCSAKGRCLNPSNSAYRNYGGRGITFCERWAGADGFANFLADMGERPPDHSLDRIDNDGPYSPENCRWATRKVQGNNKRNNVWFVVNGERITVSECAKRSGLFKTTIYDLIRNGWSMEEILTHKPAG